MPVFIYIVGALHPCLAWFLLLLETVMKEWIKKAVESSMFNGDSSRDRTVGLVVFGTIDILFGIFCFTLAMGLLIVVSAVGLGGMKLSHFMMVLGFLLLLTGWFCVMGLGSIKARRWARALLLVGAWMAVFYGTLALALMLYILPEVNNLLADSGLLSPIAALRVLYCIIFVLVLLQLVFPVIGIAFYGCLGVQATCERLNPELSWTDCRPLPLLAMGFVSITGCLLIVTAATTNYIVFFFGHILSGVLGFVVTAVISLACGYVGWGAFTRRMHAWWGAYLLVVMVSSSMMLTFSEINITSVYVSMGYTETQIESLEHFYPFHAAMLTYMACAWGVMACIYLVWVRERFRADKDIVEVRSYQYRKDEEAAAQPKETPRIRMRLD